MPALVHQGGHVIGGPALATDQPPLVASAGAPPADDALLLESGDTLLLESGDRLLLE